MVVTLVIAEDQAGQRLDRALARAADAAGETLSRSRLATLFAKGVVAGPNGPAKARDKAAAGTAYTIEVPAPVAAEPEPEDIPLEIVHEDADLILVNKPAGMVVHPAPGAETGTLVNALLAHCGDSLTGIGGTARPGIVHRIDKETSGLLVVAKSEAAHAGLSALFAAHDIERRYLAVLWGAPTRTDPRLAGLPGVSFEDGGIVRIETLLGRHPADRKRMAVAKKEGRRAVTRLRVRETFGPPDRPFASLAEFWLETGRTHQIRVHATHIGHSLVGDPVYGRPKTPSEKTSTAAQREALKHFPRQALHAAELGFKHPISGEFIRFSAKIPEDMNGLLTQLDLNI